ncbi:MAG: glutamate racemase [Chloroflexi bacterium]|nr:glutamate racemase [Chloroflexota bacterium]MQC16758.1 glutamate racemase [Chloroflexota bacterium]MQC47881.1 glutamate racemase [Chloroflexota bacterium]
MTARVGIFDSGVGGLTVAAALHRHDPFIEITYIADTAFFPYGGRDPDEVAERARVLASMLVEGGADVLVVACNTASSAALELLRAEFAVPIIGMEPPLKPAVEASMSGVVAVLATPGTARGERMARLNEQFAGGRQVFTLPMPGLADLVEAGEVQGDRVESMLREALEVPLRAGADAVALGCTHYGFLRPLLVGLLPVGVRIIDAVDPVARRTLHVLREIGVDMTRPTEVAEILCYATGDPVGLEVTIDRLRCAGADLPRLIMGRPVS